MGNNSSNTSGIFPPVVQITRILNCVGFVLGGGLPPGDYPFTSRISYLIGCWGIAIVKDYNEFPNRVGLLSGKAESMLWQYRRNLERCQDGAC